MKVWFLKAKDTPNLRGYPDEYPVEAVELPDGESMPSPWLSADREGYEAYKASFEYDSSITPEPTPITKSEEQIWHEIWDGCTSQAQQQRLMGVLPASFIVTIKVKNYSVARALLGMYLQQGAITQEDYDLIDGILPEILIQEG